MCASRFKDTTSQNTVYIISQKHAIYDIAKLTSLFFFKPKMIFYRNLSPLICRSVGIKSAHKHTMQMPKLLKILFIYSVDRSNNDS